MLPRTVRSATMPAWSVRQKRKKNYSTEDFQNFFYLVTPRANVQHRQQLPSPWAKISNIQRQMLVYLQQYAYRYKAWNEVSLYLRRIQKLVTQFFEIFDIFRFKMKVLTFFESFFCWQKCDYIKNQKLNQRKVSGATLSNQ